MVGGILNNIGTAAAIAATFGAPVLLSPQAQDVTIADAINLADKMNNNRHLCVGSSEQDNPFTVYPSKTDHDNLWRIFGNKVTKLHGFCRITENERTRVITVILDAKTIEGGKTSPISPSNHASVVKSYPMPA